MSRSFLVFSSIASAGSAGGCLLTMLGIHRMRYSNNLEIRNQLIQDRASAEHIEAYNRWLQKGFYSQLTSDPQLANKKKRRRLLTNMTSLTKKKQ